MRRADRLFQILQILRRRRLTTARRLAEELEVSERTIYRDVADLMASGVPIDGEPGMGYSLRGFDLPPLMFTEVEIEALVLGARVVESWTDPEAAIPNETTSQPTRTSVPTPSETNGVPSTIVCRRASTR
jgi:predicted DNA-binding transcriptional regulator YafY